MTDQYPVFVVTIPRLTLQTWQRFVDRCQATGHPIATERLYAFIVAVAEGQDPAAVDLGRRSSPAKADAARVNGRRGGRRRFHQPRATIRQEGE